MRVWEDVCLFELLTYGGVEYRRLMSSMLCDDFFILQDRVYDFVHEVRDSTDELIGFGCGSRVLGGCGVLLELFYLLPLYRGKFYFRDFIQYYMSECICVSLDRPNQYSVLSLLDNGLAKNMGDGLVYAFPLLSFEDYDSCERRYSHYYDLRLSAIVDFSHQCISPLQEVDIQCFNASTGRDKYFTESYFEDFITGKNVVRIK